MNGQTNAAQNTRGGRRTNHNRYPRKSNRDRGFRTVPGLIGSRDFTQAFSISRGTAGRKGDGTDQGQDEKNGKRDQVGDATRSCIAALIFERRAGIGVRVEVMGPEV